MKLLVLDNYDSFTYNLVHILNKLGAEDLEVIRNDKIAVSDISQYDKIVLSPGPGVPDEAGIMKKLIEKYAGKKPILGVCLGHQAIAEAFGGILLNLETVYHGVATRVELSGDDYIFKGLPAAIMAGRYHSWIVDKASLPSCFTVTALDENSHIMALTHNEYDLKGVQFHPESILTEYGEELLNNWLNH